MVQFNSQFATSFALITLTAEVGVVIAGKVELFRIEALELDEQKFTARALVRRPSVPGGSTATGEPFMWAEYALPPVSRTSAVDALDQVLSFLHQISTGQLAPS